MNYIFGPRQSGKTTALVKKYIEAKAADKRVCIIVPNFKHKDNLLLSQVLVSANDVFTFDSIKNRRLAPPEFERVEWDVVLIDELYECLSQFIPAGRLIVSDTPRSVDSMYMRDVLK